MVLHALRARMPVLVFVVLALFCLALLGVACACLTGDPMQAIEQALAAVPTLPALIEVWPLTVVVLAGMAALAFVGRLSQTPSPAALQRFLL